MLNSWFSLVPSGMYKKLGTKVCDSMMIIIQDDDEDRHTVDDDDLDEKEEVEADTDSGGCSRSVHLLAG